MGTYVTVRCASFKRFPLKFDIFSKGVDERVLVNSIIVVLGMRGGTLSRINWFQIGRIYLFFIFFPYLR